MNMKTKKYGESPLQMAVHSVSKSTVRFLLNFCNLEKYLETNSQNEAVFNMVKDPKMRAVLELGFHRLT